MKGTREIRNATHALQELQSLKLFRQLSDEEFRVLSFFAWSIESITKRLDAIDPCGAGEHSYALISLGPDGTNEGATYKCRRCESTDPEGDSAREREASR